MYLLGSSTDSPGEEEEENKGPHANKFLPLLTSLYPLTLNNNSKTSTNNNTSSNNRNNRNQNNAFDKYYQRTFDKNNHTFRFSKYSPRKENVLKVNNKVSYLEPYDYLSVKNKTIDFKKMSYRNEKTLINTAVLKNPSMCLYNPKYKYLEQNIARIKFNKEEFKNSIKQIKQGILNKVMTSYEVNKDYITVDNSKIPKFDSENIKI